MTAHWAILIVALLGCHPHNKKEVEAAKHSLYNTDFALVYGAALEATRELYSNIDENPGSGKISTAWHEVQMAAVEEDLGNQATLSAGATGAAGGASSSGSTGSTASTQGASSSGAAGGNSMGSPTRLASKKFFIRFDVSVIGGRPWRVKVAPHAASWDPGAAMPNELHGDAKPPWLGPRTDALQRSIYLRIKQYAVPMKEEVVDSIEKQLPQADPSAFKGVGPDAAKVLAKLSVILARRTYTSLRPLLATDIVWSDGGGIGPDGAMAVWLADPFQLEAMANTLSSCRSEDVRVICASGNYELTLRSDSRGGWKLSSFIRVE